MTNTIGIYCIRNLLNNDRYIGQSVHMETRKHDHLFALRRGTHFNPHLQHAYDVYGESNFVFEVLEECAKEILSEREIFWINSFGGYTSDSIYNLTPGGKSNYGEHNPRYGKHWSQEWRDQQSIRMKRYLSNPQNHPLYGVHPSDSTIEKQRVSHLGKSQTAASNKKRSDTLRRKYASGEIKAYMLGKHHSEATREKLRNRVLPKHSPEQLQKMSEALRGERNPMWGKQHTLESRQKLSITHKGARNSMYGMMRINNGIINTQIPKDSPIPDGFVKGMLPRKPKEK